MSTGAAAPFSFWSSTWNLSPDVVWAGWQGRRRLATIRALFTPYVPLSMEINPSLNRIKDLTERSQSLRGYL